LRLHKEQNANTSKRDEFKYSNSMPPLSSL